MAAAPTLSREKKKCKNKTNTPDQQKKWREEGKLAELLASLSTSGFPEVYSSLG